MKTTNEGFDGRGRRLGGGFADTVTVSQQERDEYIRGVLAENAHKKSLFDYSTPSRKFKTVMDEIGKATASNKARTIRYFIRLFKLDFCIRAKLPPKSHGANRSREENTLRESRRVLNWLYEVADEEYIDVTTITSPGDHFNHVVEMFVSGEKIFDIREAVHLKEAYSMCPSNCPILKKERELELSTLANKDDDDIDFEMMGQAILRSNPSDFFEKQSVGDYCSSAIESDTSRPPKKNRIKPPLFKPPPLSSLPRPRTPRYPLRRSASVPVLTPPPTFPTNQPPAFQPRKRGENCDSAPTRKRIPKDGDHYFFKGVAGWKTMEKGKEHELRCKPNPTVTTQQKLLAVGGKLFRASILMQFEELEEEEVVSDDAPF